MATDSPVACRPDSRLRPFADEDFGGLIGCYLDAQQAGSKRQDMIAVSNQVGRAGKDGPIG